MSDVESDVAQLVGRMLVESSSLSFRVALLRFGAEYFEFNLRAARRAHSQRDARDSGIALDAASSRANWLSEVEAVDAIHRELSGLTKRLRGMARDDR